jgi:hypothetical protein
MRKYDIVNALIAKNRYTRYLEICTPSTGLQFSRIDRSQLRWCHRLLYRCPEGFRDNCEITFRSEDEHVGHLLDPALGYDVILVDSFHTFECSMRDLKLALGVLRPGGAIVVHDCSPTKRELCGPTFRPGSWFGVSYCAYVEFVLSEPNLVHYTVNTDCGCGVIKKASLEEPAVGHGSGTELGRLWHSQTAQQEDMFDFFIEHRRELLNLISVKDFRSREKIGHAALFQWQQNLAGLLRS